MGDRKLVTIDCETDPFKAGRVPAPFIWGSFDGKDFRTFANGGELCDFYSDRYCYLYAHNGGKFDFMFLLPFVKETRVKLINSRIVEMRIGQALLRDSFAILPEALDKFQKSKFEYWKLERDTRAAYQQEIEEYLKSDCVNLWTLVNAFHKSAGKGSTIAGNALNFARRLGIDPGKTHHNFDTTFREFYYGGRVEAFRGGVFANVNLFDIQSAYPYAMSHNHGNGDRYIVHSSLETVPNHRIGPAFIDITCYSRGAFPLRDKYSMSFPFQIGNFKVTGWEYLTAKKHGLIDGENIKAVYTLDDEIDFTAYVDHWFEHKQKAKDENDKAQYFVGKYMMNSLYGKLAQNPINYFDYHIYPAGTPVDWVNGWQKGAVFDDLEIHERPTLWKWREKHGDDWVKFPCYYNVATAASITGFTRAHLLDAIHTVGSDNVIYCDTDCIFVKSGAPTDLLRQDNRLGSWEWEGLADPCYIAGKKLYGVKFINGPKTGEIKIASKGWKATLADMEKLINGEIVEWKNEAPTFSLGKAPAFVVRKIRATAQL